MNVTRSEVCVDSNSESSTVCTSAKIDESAVLAKGHPEIPCDLKDMATRSSMGLLEKSRKGRMISIDSCNEARFNTTAQVTKPTQED